jgi:hypothetical protein
MLQNTAQSLERFYMHQVKTYCAIGLAALMLQAGPSAGQGSKATLSELEVVLEKVVRDFAEGRTEEAVKSMAQLGEPYRAENTRALFQGFSPFGKPLYYDKLVDRGYGMTGKDLIYKIGYHQNMVFLRFTLHKQNESWLLTNFLMNNENQAPFPRSWQHIYP